MTKKLVWFEIHCNRKKQVKTNMTLGHVRYSTSGAKTNPLDDVQPLYGNGNKNLGEFVIAHNGNIPHIANKTDKSVRTTLSSF